MKNEFFVEKQQNNAKKEYVVWQLNYLLWIRPTNSTLLPSQKTRIER